VAGDVSSLQGAEDLWQAAQEPFSGLDAVVISVNAPNVARQLIDWSSQELADLFASNLLVHHNVIKAMSPKLAPDGVLVGIGGGTADFILPQMAHLSIMQAAQRMMYRGFAKERPGGPRICELMLISMIAGSRKRDVAEDHWITDVEVGEHVCAIIGDPAAFPGPILRLESREQIGRPEPTRSTERA
jgi:NAD(P)-dependent dehydrogenase (short-subunit alcohol dehydrogenase family)